MTDTQIVHVSVHGHTLDAVRQGERVKVVLRRACEELGLDHSAQLQKLKGRPWATMAMIPTVAEDGRTREIQCLDLDALPMWLATINPSKVRPELREKLELFQREAAAVLRDHFFGRPGAYVHTAPQAPVDLEAIAGAVAAILLPQVKGILTAPLTMQPTVGPAEGARFNRALTGIGRSMHLGCPEKPAASWRQTEVLELREAVDHWGAWEDLPSGKAAQAWRWVERRKAKVANITGPRRQTPLFQPTKGDA